MKVRKKKESNQWKENNVDQDAITGKINCPSDCLKTWEMWHVSVVILTLLILKSSFMIQTIIIPTSYTQHLYSQLHCLTSTLCDGRIFSHCCTKHFNKHSSFTIIVKSGQLSCKVAFGSSISEYLQGLYCRLWLWCWPGQWWQLTPRLTRSSSTMPMIEHLMLVGEFQDWCQEVLTRLATSLCLLLWQCVRARQGSGETHSS